MTLRSRYAMLKLRRNVVKCQSIERHFAFEEVNFVSSIRKYAASSFRLQFDRKINLADHIVAEKAPTRNPRYDRGNK